MRARTVLLGTVVTLVAVDAALMLSLGTIVSPGPHNLARHLVCGVGAFLLARRSDRPGNAVLAAASVAGAAVLSILVSMTPYVITGQAAAEPNGPALLLAVVLGAVIAGVFSGVVGAATGWLANRLARDQIAAARAPAGRRRKFP